MTFVSLSLKQCYRNTNLPCLVSYFQSNYHFKYFSTKDEPETADKSIKRKTTPIPKITLISGSSISVTTLEEAQKLSKRRELKLVKIIDLDTKTQRPTYQLMTGAEYHQEDLKQREARKKQKSESFIKGDKLLMLKDSISEHDLEIHLKKILKWLSKSYQVNVVINGNSANMEKSEKVFSSVSNFVGTEGRILQKTTKGADLKFHIIPPKEQKKEEL